MSKEEVTRCYAKYIFLDVVQFSKRSAEAQSEIVQHLNELVRQSLNSHKVNYDEDCILIPTGDGMCIALASPNLPYDAHIQIAFTVLQSLDEYNKAAQNETRRYQVRIGINQNTDILVTDINGRRNVAGAGINMASRIMDKADAGQVLVSQAVYHELQPSETYMDKFKGYTASGKHNISFQVYQYVGDGHAGLNADVPSVFAPQHTEVQIQVIRGHEKIYKAYEGALKSLSKGEPHVIRSVASLPPSEEVAIKWDSFLVPFLETRSEVTYKRTIIVNGTTGWPRRKEELQQRYLAKRLSNYKQFEAEGPPSIECLLLDDSLAFVTFASAGRPFESSGLRINDRRICKELEHYFENQLLPDCKEHKLVANQPALSD